MKNHRAAIEREVLETLRSQVGEHWCEVEGELQEGFGECALWILLYEDSDPLISHQALCDVLRPVMESMEPVEFTVTYTVLTEVFDIAVDQRMNNAEILAALDDPTFAKRSMSRPRGQISPFAAKTSGLRPT